MHIFSSNYRRLLIALLFASAAMPSCSTSIADDTNGPNCACPELLIAPEGSYCIVEVAGYPKFTEDPLHNDGINEGKDGSRLIRTATASDGHATASVFAFVDNDWTWGDAKVSGTATATFKAEQRWRWCSDKGHPAPGVQIAATYEIEGMQTGKAVVGSDDGVFADPAHAGAVAAYAALFDITCGNKDIQNRALIVSATNTTSNGVGAEGQLGLEAGDEGTKIGVGGSVNVVRDYGNPSAHKTLPITGGGVLNIETSASVIIVKRSGAIAATSSVWSNGNNATATSRVELSINFVAPMLTLCTPLQHYEQPVPLPDPGF